MFLIECNRWSPDGSSIAYWRLDQSQVPIVHLINNTDTVYPKLVPIHYPKTGDLNSSVSVRVVRIADSSVTILPLDVLGDTQRENYIADMNYHSETGTIIIQSLNRLQNHLKVCLCDPLLLTVSVVFEDKDEAWVDISHELRWVDSKSFLYLTERNGWRQICVVHIEGSSSQVKYLTSPGYDAESIVGVNRQSGDVYFIASPDSPLYRYLYRVNLRDGGSTSVRVTPEEWTGTSSYDVSKDGRFAVHGFSAARRCPTYR
jgi:dipeptidyl-peptidase 4